MFAGLERETEDMRSVAGTALLIGQFKGSCPRLAVGGASAKGAESDGTQQRIGTQWPNDHKGGQSLQEGKSRTHNAQCHKRPDVIEGK